LAANPQRILSWASIRLIRQESIATTSDALGVVSLDKSFTGNIPQQIRNIRVYFQESGFFKKYQTRNPDGGFSEQPELPLVAVDEAIVNAVAHRDYAVKLPIECKKYSDAFCVTNSGRVLQREKAVPEDFSLAEISLDHVPRNPKLLEWLKLMRDERGAEFVRALSEGTRRMRDEMEKLGLPAPRFHVSPAQTTITLFNNAGEREALLRSVSTTKSTEFTNLFPPNFTNGSSASVAERPQLKREITFTLQEALRAAGWFIDRSSHGRVRAHKRGLDISVPKEATRILRFYPAYSFQVREYWGAIYLTIDYCLEVKNIRTLAEILAELAPSDLVGKTAVAHWNGWQNGKIRKVEDAWAELEFFDFGTTQTVSADKIIPNLPTKVLESLLRRNAVKFDLSREIKRAALASEPNASRLRAARTEALADELSRSVFPLFLGRRAAISLQPAGAIDSRDAGSAAAFQASSVAEPKVEFHHHYETEDIREGITTVGAYDTDHHDVELVPMCTIDTRQPMAALIERLKVGKYKYKGAERTFSTRFSYGSIFTVESPEALLDECTRVLGEHPNWVGDSKLNRLFLVHVPEQDHALDDETSPYYRVKRLLLEAGIPSQMVDTPTLLDPDWKDLNLALNIIAKCGVVPWVLPGAVPDADFFVGLSYTQKSTTGTDPYDGLRQRFQFLRTMGLLLGEQRSLCL
jgi:hypothetical protein